MSAGLPWRYRLAVLACTALTITLFLAFGAVGLLAIYLALEGMLLAALGVACFAGALACATYLADDMADHFEKAGGRS